MRARLLSVVMSAMAVSCGYTMRDGVPHGAARCATVEGLDKDFHKPGATDLEQEAVRRLDQPTPELCQCLRDYPSTGDTTFRVSFTVPAGAGESAPEMLRISGNGRESPLAACLGTVIAGQTFPAGPADYAIDYALNVVRAPRNP